MIVTPANPPSHFRPAHSHDAPLRNTSCQSDGGRYGWNQCLWPLLVATDPGLDTIVIGIVKMIGLETQTDWSAVMATAVLALLPPVVVVVLMQRWLVVGLTEGEK